MLSLAHYCSELKEKIQAGNLTVGIVGMGYVGLPLALRFAEENITTLGFDIDARKVNAINEGRSYIKHISDQSVAMASATALSATSDFSKIADVDAIIICVPTPLSRFRDPDLSYIHSSMEAIAPYLRKGQLLSLESTTYPGTTEEMLKPRVTECGLKVGEDFFLVFSPEREDPGNKDFTTKTVPKVVGGETPACLEVGVALYAKIIDTVVPVSSTRAAEMTKLLENIHRAVNIGLVNELKTITNRMGIDIHEVIQAASTKPFGFAPYTPGPGLGGHCIPIDPFYFSWKAKEFGATTRFIELAGEVNESMPDWVVSQTVDALSDRRKPLRGSRILVLGIAYKKNIDDVRESPSLKLMSILSKKGAVLNYSDPFVARYEASHEYHHDMESVALTPENLRQYDAVIVATNHDAFDYAMIRQHADLVIDTRGVYRARHENVVLA